MGTIVKATMITFVVIMILAAGALAIAVKPAYTGVKYPAAVDGQMGSVTGRVTASTNTTGLVGAYIAIVNASNVSEEYCNTTSGADGHYQFVGVNATYNATNLSDVGPNGRTPYMIYAYMPPYGEGYSAAFGVDAFDSGDSTSPGTSVSQIAVSESTPTPTVAATPTPAAIETPTPTPSSTPVTETTTGAVSTSTPTPTPKTPAPSYLFSMASLLFAGYMATAMISRRRKN